MSKLKRNKIAYKDEEESKSFDLYIKKLDEGWLDNLTKESFKKKKETQRRHSNTKLHSHSNLLQRRLDKKASQRESKESELTQANHELELKAKALIKELEEKDKELLSLKSTNTQLLLENNHLSNLNSVLQEKNQGLEKKISKLILAANKQKAIEDKSERYSSESDDMLKEHKSMKKLIQFQKEKIRALEGELKKAIINSHKEKEGIYAKRIDTLERINKELEIKVNHQQDHQQQFKDQLCLLLLKEKTDNNCINEGSNINNTKKQIFTFKNKGNSGTTDKISKLERLIKEKDVLLCNGNYANNDALILRIDEKINELLGTINHS